MSVRLFRRAALPAAVVLVAVLSAAGCGDKKKDDTPKIDVRGKLVEGTKPWTFDVNKGVKLPPGVSAPPVAPGTSTSLISLGFHPTDGGDFVSGYLDTTTGTFNVNGLKPGRYKISLALNMGMAPPGARDPFGGKFASDKTQIVRDLTKNGEEIVIDVSKPNG